MARKHVQPGFFDLDDRYAALSKIGDPLEQLAAVIDFEPFRYRLEKALKRSDGSKGGRPPYDCVMMSRSWCCKRCTGFQTIRRSS